MIGVTDMATPRLIEKKSSVTKIAEAAVKAGALIIVNAAKEEVPVLTGTLRAGIHAENVDRKLNEISARIGVSKIVYARAIEYGHSKRKPKGYLRVSLYAKQDEATREIRDILKAKL